MRSELIAGLILFLLTSLITNVFAMEQYPTTSIAIPIEVIKTNVSEVNVSITVQPSIEIEIRRAADIVVPPQGCKDLCGDGICQEIVCMATNCPCPETKENCPKDCTSVSPLPVTPLISLPPDTRIKISPVEIKPILIEGKPVEFKGIDEIPKISIDVKPVLAPTISSEAVEIICKEALKKEFDVCISTGNSTEICKLEYERSFKEKCVGKTSTAIAEQVDIPSVSIRVNVDQEKKLTKIEIGDVVAVTHEVIKFEQSSLKIETPKTNISIQVLPHIATSIATSKEPQKVEATELKVIDEKPVYEINGTRDAKLLWIFPVTLPIRTSVNAETGKIERLEKPWWSFLAW
ncbi:MAG: PepSY domain-containing protein [Candidatus Parvarchaeota archaeon]|nr:PepSY domain-containing protein [Candidatus Jingweiarchaeum tengchongense]MCW1298105.1 PepSY domain-containing protein [Candidatus Jingweiarchaeum tengchongense]MCW1300713.1 PepSY domain-containing protein [Candidatus Jingweiarchaeum tengchongense]MCW1305527.1 PepSY domain-containing protein [Candidatus Jingweiarchaeum tengchongense]MCW1310345.1 PepSY domain-containing protein [Candidatus Jingweiarchaeum tengchongense]